MVFPEELLEMTRFLFAVALLMKVQSMMPSARRAAVSPAERPTSLVG